MPLCGRLHRVEQDGRVYDDVMIFAEKAMCLRNAVQMMRPIKILFGIYDITMSMRSPMNDMIWILTDYGCSI